jgi:hypothetical protein
MTWSVTSWIAPLEHWEYRNRWQHQTVCSAAMIYVSALRTILATSLLGVGASLGLAGGFAGGTDIYQAERNPTRIGERKLNPDLLEIPVGNWIKMHQQRPSDKVTFKRQSHAGSAFDTRRGRIIIFGSDTHAKDWSNSPLFFDVLHLEWSRLYPDDDPSTYQVNSQGIPVAGVNGDHPWAMHTFGSAEYDPVGDALIVSSYPQHLAPGRFTDVLANVWPEIRQHPTWVLDLETKKWRPLAGRAVHFFPYATAYDRDRRVIIGYKSAGVFELDLQSRLWHQVKPKGLLGYGNNAIYDMHRRALIVFGSKERTNDIVVYKPATKQHLKMSTAGIRPPRSRYNPMAFHAGVAKTVVLVDRAPDDKPNRDLAKMQTETWLYDLGKDEWTQIKSATLPFGCGMNYNMEYDPAHDVLLLVANPPEEPTAVWALRL